jgi:hypothetical protein
MSSHAAAPPVAAGETEGGGTSGAALVASTLAPQAAQKRAPSASNLLHAEQFIFPVLPNSVAMKLNGSVMRDAEFHGCTDQEILTPYVLPGNLMPACFISFVIMPEESGVVRYLAHAIFSLASATIHQCVADSFHRDSRPPSDEPMGRQSTSAWLLRADR